MTSRKKTKLPTLHRRLTFRKTTGGSQFNPPVPFPLSILRVKWIYKRMSNVRTTVNQE